MQGLRIAHLAVALEAAELARSIWATAPGRDITAVKGPADYATLTDTSIENAVVAHLTEGTGHPVQGEEFTADTDTGTRWIVDPVDGTHNLILGLPLTALTICLVEDDTPVVALVAHYDTRDTFTAVAGQGARLNGARIQVTKAALCDTAVTFGNVRVRENHTCAAEARIAALAHAGNLVGKTRMFGTSALHLAWVAAGRTGATVEFGNRPWDTAAGALLVQEAGGVVRDLHGDPWTLRSGTCVGGPAAHVDQLLAYTRR